MQLNEQEQALSVFAPLGWIGVDLLSIVPLVICFILGCLVKRYWSWSRKYAQAALKKKKMDDEDEVAEQDLNKQAVDASAQNTAQVMKKKARQANAQERKRNKKVNEVAKLVPADRAATAPVAMEISPQVPETVEEADEDIEWQKWETKTDKKLAKTKKGKSKQPILTVQPEEKESFNQQCEQEKAQPAASAECLPEATEQEAVPEMPSKEYIVEEQAFDENEESADGATCGSEVQGSTDIELPIDEKIEDATPSTDSNLGTDSVSEILNADSKSPSEHEAEESGAYGITTPQSTPDMTPRNYDSTPMQWCGMETEPICDMQLDHGIPPEAQVEGWVPVAIPVEYFQAVQEGEAVCPVTFIDGYWQNGAGENIYIDGSDIAFENGPMWRMKDRNFNGFIIELNGEDYYAEVGAGGHQITWSDGDLWTRVDVQMQPEPMWIQDPCQYENMMMPAEAFLANPEMICMPAMEDQKFQTGEKAEEEDWEVCWEFSKSGWCRKGDRCEWKHVCSSSRTWRKNTWREDEPFVDRPFVEDAN